MEKYVFKYKSWVNLLENTVCIIESNKCKLELSKFSWIDSIVLNDQTALDYDNYLLILLCSLSLIQQAIKKNILENKNCYLTSAFTGLSRRYDMS